MTRNLAIFLLATLLLPLPAYALSPGDAQEWLRGKNVPYTADEFVTRAARGDITVMNLFLDAGMDPDAKNKDGRTAMQVAIEQARGEIIKILVDRGADREPLISMIGDKGTLLQDCESFGYLFISGEVQEPSSVRKFVMGTSDFVEVLPPTVYRESKVEQEGGFGGLGIVISLDENNILSVISVIENTPAAGAGINAGDKIIEVNGESTEGILLEDAVKKLRGLKGSQVSVTVKRLRPGFEEAEETLNLTLIRDRIKIPSVKGHLLDDDIGYIRVVEFGRQTADDFREEFNKLESQGMRHLVLDLRHNPGGLVGVAADVADEFLEKDRLICSAEFAHASTDAELKAKTGASVCFETPVVVLVNMETSGASEMVAAALRHWGAGVLLGEKTPGMGSIQSTVPLPDGSALNFTTAKLLTPNHDPINRVGLTPDIIVKMSKESIVRHLMTPGDPQTARGESGEGGTTDEQLRRAVEFLQSYYLSRTLEKNINAMRVRIDLVPVEEEQEIILWDQPVEETIFEIRPRIKQKIMPDREEPPQSEQDQGDD